MAGKTATQVRNEILMFGCEPDQFRKSVEESITFKVAGIGMVLASLMSDAQEEMARGSVEDARQTLNRAKYLISEFQIGLNLREG